MPSADSTDANCRHRLFRVPGDSGDDRDAGLRPNNPPLDRVGPQAPPMDYADKLPPMPVVHNRAAVDIGGNLLTIPAYSHLRGALMTCVTGLRVSPSLRNPDDEDRAPFLSTLRPGLLRDGAFEEAGTAIRDGREADC